MDSKQNDLQIEVDPRNQNEIMEDNDFEIVQKKRPAEVNLSIAFLDSKN
jgi:hypothetical protein